MKNATCLIISVFIFLFFPACSIQKKEVYALESSSKIILEEDIETRNKLRHKNRNEGRTTRKKLRHKGRIVGQFRNRKATSITKQ